MNKWNMNLLHTFPKQDILNSKNIHVVTRSGAGEDIYPDLPSQQKGGQNAYPDLDHEERIMREVMQFFKNINQD
jgi:hypothetical protein